MISILSCYLRYFGRDELAKLREDNAHLATRLGLDPTPAVHLRAPSVSSFGSNSHAGASTSGAVAPGPAIASWIQSFIPPAGGVGVFEGGSEHIPSRAPSVKSDAGSHTSGRGLHTVSPPAQPNGLQSLVPQAGSTDQPLAMPWGKLF